MPPQTRRTAWADTTARAVTVTATDSGPGIAVVEYSTDSGDTWQAYAAPVKAGNDGVSVACCVEIAGPCRDRMKTSCGLGALPLSRRECERGGPSRMGRSAHRHRGGALVMLRMSKGDI